MHTGRGGGRSTQRAGGVRRIPHATAAAASATGGREMKSLDELVSELIAMNEVMDFERKLQVPSRDAIESLDAKRRECERKIIAEVLRRYYRKRGIIKRVKEEGK